MNAYEFSWVVIFIALEFFLVAFFVCACYFSSFIFYIKNKRDKKRLQELERIFLQNKPIPPSLIKYTELILSLFKKLDARMLPDWNHRKIQLMHEQILPYARSYIAKKQWEKRYLLALCFDYVIEPRDEDLLIQLIEDKNAVVSFNAIRTGSRMGTPKVLKAILYRLQQEPHPFHVVTISELTYSDHWMEVLKEALNSATDPWINKICYEILKAIGPRADFFEIAKRDCFNDNINVRLAVIRVLPYIDKTKYLEVYAQLLKDDNWLVRNSVVKTLSELKDEASISLLVDSLHDSVWWVHVHAAKALAFMGESGRRVLTEHMTLKTMEHREEASYFLKIQQLRTHPDYD